MSNNPASSNVEGDTTSKPRPKARGRVTVIRERCKGCGYCVEFCPSGVLAMSPEFNVKGYHFPALSDGRDCTGCDLCGMFCPDYAIHGARVPAPQAGEQQGK
jgi:2-oxoglutarate ferredoxin oxidoreductase subunit delta